MSEKEDRQRINVRKKYRKLRKEEVLEQKKTKIRERKYEEKEK